MAETGNPRGQQITALPKVVSIAEAHLGFVLHNGVSATYRVSGGLELIECIVDPFSLGVPVGDRSWSLVFQHVT